MTATYTFIQGSTPLVISMPHNGQALPDDIAAIMTDEGKRVADTDWYKDKLYDFAKALGANIIIPHFNRYVIDLNRDPDGIDLYPGADNTELCPTTAFNSQLLYLKGSPPDIAEQQRRVEQYWQPYHQVLANTLAKLKAEFGKAVLLEAHSIKSVVPRFFEGQLPDFNFGNANGESCSAKLIDAISSLDYFPYSQVVNGRFKGGYITRAYGKPDENIHALQLELSQRTYMDESTFSYDEQLAQQVKPKLEQLVKCLLNFADQ